MSALLDAFFFIKALKTTTWKSRYCDQFTISPWPVLWYSGQTQNWTLWLDSSSGRSPYSDHLYHSCGPCHHSVKEINTQKWKTQTKNLAETIHKSIFFTCLNKEDMAVTTLWPTCPILFCPAITKWTKRCSIQVIYTNTCNNTCIN